jgi:hypothetical protein
MSVAALRRVRHCLLTSLVVRPSDIIPARTLTTVPPKVLTELIASAKLTLFVPTSDRRVHTVNMRASSLENIF